jgi:membrane protein YqaA with SNARE-associated domain
MLLAFVWALAEATVWPIMPDALLVPLAARRPRSWWRLVLGAALGTIVGGTVSYRIGRSRPDAAAVAALPLVRAPMVQAASRWLAAAGARGVLRQPPSGVPYKVFARLAGSQGIALGPFLGWTLAARGGRFLFSVGGAMVARWWFPALGDRWFWQATAVWCVAFGLGLWRTVRAWEAPLPPDDASP